MIILSGVLVVVAIGLLVAGIVAGNGEGAEVLGLEALTVIYISIAVSIVSALCLALGVFLRRKELFGAGSASRSASAKPKKVKRGKKADRAVPAKDGQPKDGQPLAQEAKKDTGAAGPADEQPTIVAQPQDVPEEALVYVVRGRKRYHLETCRQLAGKDKEDLTYVEAKEEGFSPCTACLPDTALAARAAAAAATPAVAKPSEKDKKATKAQPVAANAPAAPAKPTLGKAAPPTASPTAPPATPTAAKPPQPAADTKPPSAWPATPPTPAPTVTDQPLPQREPVKPEPVKSEPVKPAPEPAKAEAPPAVVQSAAAPSAPRPRQGQAGQTAETGPADPQVRILSGTKRYHRADCALIEDIGDEADDLEALPRAEAKARGCTPCLVCQPDKEHARD